jgi:hypothetical protein
MSALTLEIAQQQLALFETAAATMGSGRPYTIRMGFPVPQWGGHRLSDLFVSELQELDELRELDATADTVVALVDTDNGGEIERRRLREFQADIQYRVEMRRAKVLSDLETGWAAAVGHPDRLSARQEWIEPSKAPALTNWDLGRSIVAEDRPGGMQYINTRIFFPIPDEDGGGCHYDHASVQRGIPSAARGLELPSPPAAKRLMPLQDDNVVILASAFAAGDAATKSKGGRKPGYLRDEILDQHMLEMITNPDPPASAAALARRTYELNGVSKNIGEDISGVSQGWSSRFPKTWKFLSLT